MRDAAVGHQCPVCVKEGQRSTRQARSTYGGNRSGDPRTTSFVLIAINVVVFVALLATGGSGGALYRVLVLIPDGFAASTGDGSAVVVRGVADGAWWQLLTSAFCQTAVFHLLFNMLTLYFLGPVLEAKTGRARFLAVYLGSALTGSLGVLLLSSPYSVTLGASGAIFGVLGGVLVTARKSGADIRQLGVWAAIMLLYPLFFRGSSISWQGHLGGLVGGLVLSVAIAYAPRGPRRSLVQWGAVVVVVALSLVGVALRVLSLS